jgi:ribosomal protein S18 acetylase RimI-like enzyme
MTIADYESSVRYYSENNDNNTIMASTLLLDKVTAQVVGVCMVSKWEGLPLFYEVAVHPRLQGRGLATTMMKKALTTLKAEYPVVRLFVTLGNDAERVYSDLGFLGGTELMSFYLPAQSS